MLDQYAVPRRHAARVLGVPETQFRGWLDRGLFSAGRGGKGSHIPFTLARCLDAAAARDLIDLGLGATDACRLANNGLASRAIPEGATEAAVGKTRGAPALRTMPAYAPGHRIVLDLPDLYLSVYPKFVAAIIGTTQNIADFGQAVRDHEDWMARINPTVADHAAAALAEALGAR